MLDEFVWKKLKKITFLFNIIHICTKLETIWSIQPDFKSSFIFNRVMTSNFEFFDIT
jgi:hypothetical protein